MEPLSRIFIVEDHTWVREALTAMLSLQPGLEVCGSAGSAEEALEALPAGADLVLVDVGLPDRSGINLLATIRERWPDLPCVVLSNQPPSLFADAARDAGSSDYVEKGNAPELLAAIHRTLGTAQEPQ
jgi:DNA-binding NarL/FixJ family response regulator